MAAPRSWLHPAHGLTLLMDSPAMTDSCPTRNWKLILAYGGAAYHGWQVQPGLPTVQGALANAIAHVTGEAVLPQGSGRTDTGVHAEGQVASFRLDSPIPAANLLHALNRALPPAIRVLSVEAAAADFHARHSARAKTYQYRIHTAEPCPPWIAPYVFACNWPLDLDAMQRAAQMVLGEHDFTSFAALDPDLHARGNAAPSAHPASNVRTIFSSSWQREHNTLIYTVRGSGFLHHMVRNLVGTFIDIGRGRIAADEVRAILAAQSRSAAGPTAPANGLFLMHVEY